jgi:hypothetical protein
MRRCLVSLISATALAACDEKTVGPTGAEPTQPFGRMRVVHAVPNATIADRVNVNVDGVPFGVNIAYGGVAPSGATLYFTAYEGNRQVAVRRTADTTVKVLDQAVAIAANTDHTVFIVRSGTAAGTMVVTDDNSPPSEGNVKLRLVHLASTAGAVDVYVTAPNASIATIAPTIPNVAPGTVSQYQVRSAGAHQVRLTTAGTKIVVASVTTAALTAGAIRTIVSLDPVTGTTLPAPVVLTDR